MSTKRVATNTNRIAVFIIAILVIFIAFLLLGGGPWLKGMMHGLDKTIEWNWALIFISLAIGFLVGLLVGRRK